MAWMETAALDGRRWEGCGWRRRMRSRAEATASARKRGDDNISLPLLPSCPRCRRPASGRPWQCSPSCRPTTAS
ncbi:Os08g0402650 [Oryza sativa Japonica Group]|uniref:Os08g0402650 protein n=1 Tax=Oryza sativa subsp. japonica TaxID=39947 RepID=A0A0P0XFK8_ORYSJ|nr:Os08g0402650 [Oryza sativa Japonica Group]